MKISIDFGSATPNGNVDFVALPVFQTKDKKAALTGWPKAYQAAFKQIKIAEQFDGSRGQSQSFYLADGTTALALGLGEKSKCTSEILRREMAKLYHQIANKYQTVAVMVDEVVQKGKLDQAVGIVAEAMLLARYKFDKHKSETKAPKLSKLVLVTEEKKAQSKAAEAQLAKTESIAESINFARDLVNEPPNILNSVTYAKEIEKDAKKLPGVKIKILGKAEIKQEKMGMFLSVNSGSAHDPRLVHLTYTPKNAKKNTKHVALVGKGLTFDTGGYSLKPAASMVNMKFDMAGSATVYAAFRAAVLMKANVKISCFMGMTDNAINSEATMPDSIVKARNGKTVEILNTDAEGRLVLGDVLSYACDQNPDAIIDAATLTGACLVALGTEVCGVMGNDRGLLDAIAKSAKAVDEYTWELPIIQEYREDMKSPNADLRNVGTDRFAGTAKAAAFLEYFVKPDIAWAHLDIAGVGDSQSYLPYCPSKGASGIMVRTLVHYLNNV